MSKKELEIINAINVNNVKKLRKICDCIVPGTLEAEDKIITIAIKRGNLEIVKILMTTLKFNLIKRSFFLALLHCEDEIADYLKKFLDEN